MPLWAVEIIGGVALIPVAVWGLWPDMRRLGRRLWRRP